MFPLSVNIAIWFYSKMTLTTFEFVLYPFRYDHWAYTSQFITSHDSFSMLFAFLHYFLCISLRVQYALISHWFLTWISDVKVIHNICLKLNFFLEMFVILDYTFFRNRKMPFENVIFPYLICLEDEFILSLIVYAFIVIWHYFW